MFSLIKRISRNKIFLYMGSRYITYALQFVTSMIIAFKLGPEAFGTWSFILLIINIFNVIDFGISNSVNVLLVQDRDDSEKVGSHIMSSVFITSCISLIVFLIYKFAASGSCLSLINKYQITDYLPFILFVIITAYFNKLFAAIYRVKNRLFEIALYQSIVPVLLFVAILSFSNNTVWYLLLSYLVGYTISILVFLFRKQISFRSKTSFQDICLVSSKGFWLFLYNGCFYLIMYTTSLFVSCNYEVEEYGKYNFAYTLAHAIVLLIDAFGFVVFPKMIDRLKAVDSQTSDFITYVRTNYMSFIYVLVFAAMPCFYILCKFVPQYSDTSRALCISGLTLLPYANAFGLNTFLIAQNKEKNLSVISILCLAVNVLLSFLLTLCVHVAFDLVLLATLITYIVYTYLCAWLTTKYLGKRPTFLTVWEMEFPVRYFIPFVMGIIIILFGSEKLYLLFLPFIMFCILNYKDLFTVGKTLIKITNNPTVVDLK